jgi:hypothetical protein
LKIKADHRTLTAVDPAPDDLRNGVIKIRPTCAPK